ncbi:IclR family transcriptional regulator [Hansschlegelia sp. KR7-227]|uniref:IclR family transcriptional regulator n=1 Tax=Hansschlegelia sp. KR7-227 TaxID=3400914 RepID=UPI003BFDDD79
MTPPPSVKALDLDLEDAQDGRNSAIQKAVAIMERLVSSDQPPTLAELAASLGMPKPSVHRLLTQLEDVAFVARDLDGRCYRPGPRWKRLASETLVAVGRQPAIREIMSELVGRVTESCNLAMLQDGEIVYVERVECEWPLRVQLQAGSRVPIHCTSSGKLLVAWMDPARRERFVRSLQLKRHTPNTIVDADQLLEECARIRQDGVSLNREEHHLGLIGVAVPVLRGDGGAAAALAIHAPVFRMSIETARGMVPYLTDAARKIAEEAALV